MKVLIADKFQASGLSALEKLGAKVISDPSATPESLPGLMAEHDPDVLIVRSTKVYKDTFDSANKLTLVIRAGAGYDNIDVDAASAAGISVATCPGKNAIAVAEVAWAHILGCDRDIAGQTAALVRGEWDKKGFAKSGLGLYGRTLGVLGTGHIGKEIIKRAHAFGMRVVAWSRSLTPEDASAMGCEWAASPMDVAKKADIVSVSVASTPETKGLISAEFIAQMKDGSTLINTSRGAVVDEKALAEAVRTRGLRAGLDVYADQPTPESKESAIDLAKNGTGSGIFTGTHHCGASTEQAQEAIAAEAVRIVRMYRDTGEIPNVINLIGKSSATRLLVVRHLNKPGVLAHIVGRISEAKLNIEEMENVIYQSATAACAKIQLDAEPDAETLKAIRSGNANILSVDLNIID